MLCVRSDARKTMVALAWAGSLYVQRSRRRRGDDEAAGMLGDGIGSVEPSFFTQARASSPVEPKR